MNNFFIRFLYFLILFLQMNVLFSLDYDALAHQISIKTAKTLVAKHNLSIVGFGGGTMHGVEIQSLSFEVQGPIKIQKARKLVVDCAETLLKNFNSNKKIRPYLAEYPFPPSRIELTFFIKKERNQQGKNFLHCFYLTNTWDFKKAKVVYSIKNDDGLLEDLLEESYSEAKKRVNQKKLSRKGFSEND